jgi:hypothetical protein
MKKTVISVYLFTPKQKLTLNYILCGSLLNRIFGDQKAVFVRIYPSSKIPNSSEVVILFRLMKKTVISANLFTPEKKTHVQLRFVLFVSESDFWGTKSCFIRIYPSSNIPDS